jgi:hypothetical protein
VLCPFARSSSGAVRGRGVVAQCSAVVVGVGRGRVGVVARAAWSSQPDTSGERGEASRRGGGPLRY